MWAVDAVLKKHIILSPHTMKSATIYSLYALAASIIFLAVVVSLKPFASVLGAAPLGQSAYLQTATTSAVGPQDSNDTIFAASSDNSCKARVVSTTGLSAIMLNFGEPGADRAGNISSTTVSGSVGHWQAASTTVVYDSGLYGCGQWSAFSYASQTITISEF